MRRKSHSISFKILNKNVQFVSPANLSGFKTKLKTPKKGVFWSHWLANCVLKPAF